MADKNFEHKVQKQMEDFKLHPSDAVWQNVDAQLRKDKRRRWFFFLLAASVFIVAGNGLYYTLQQKPTIATINKADDKTHAAAPAVNQNPLPVTIATTSASTVPGKETPIQKIKEEKNNIVSLPSNNKIITKTPVTFNQSLQAYIAVINDKSTNKIQQHQPSTNINVKSDAVVKQPAVHLNSDGSALSYVIANPVQKNIVVSNSFSESKATQTLAAIEDSTSIVQPTLPTTVPASYIVSNNDSAVATSPSAISETKKRKWQTGFQINFGLADIVETLFPGGKYKSFEANAYTGGISGGIPPNFISGITTNAYSVRSNANIGLGFVMRKPIFKQSWLVAGVQYQFNRFLVHNRISRDTFSAAQNRLVNAFTTETKQSFTLHYIQIPTEIQWHIAKTTKGNLMLGAGLLHNFRFAGTSARPLFADSSSGANFYQPLLQLTPAYEWKGKYGPMQLGWYIHYGLPSVYNGTSKNHWWQTGVQFQYYFLQKK